MFAESPATARFYPTRPAGWQTPAVILLLKILNALAFAAIGVTLLERAGYFNRAMAQVDEALSELGLPVTGNVGGSARSMGRIDNVPIEVWLLATGRKAGGGLSVQVQSSPVGLSSILPRPSKRPQIGDLELERHADIAASPEFVLTHLQGDVRAAVLRLMRDGWSIQAKERGGGLTATVPALPEEIAEALRDLLTLVRAPGPERITDGLLHRLRNEPRASIRAACLRVLLAQPASDEERSGWIEETRADRDEAVRRVALHEVVELGGTLSVREGLDLLGSPHDADRLAGLNVVAKAPEFPEPLVLACVRGGSNEVAVRASGILAARGSRAGVPALAHGSKRPDLSPASRSRIAAARDALVRKLGGDNHGGGLTLADEQPHQLSLADGAVGQVAVVEAKK